jgi:integrase/recombinase XerC
MRMSELEIQIGRYLAELARVQTSPHTLKAYSSDLRQFLEYFTPPEGQPPPLARFEMLEIREWLADVYSRNLEAVSIRRKLAAVRSLFRFLLREGLIPMNPARLVRTPKAPKTLPDVMTAE